MLDILTMVNNQTFTMVAGKAWKISRLPRRWNSSYGGGGADSALGLLVVGTLRWLRDGNRVRAGKGLLERFVELFVQPILLDGFVDLSLAPLLAGQRAFIP